MSEPEIKCVVDECGRIVYRVTNEGVLLSKDEKELIASHILHLQAENAKLRELVADMWFWHYEGHIDSESRERQMLHIDAVIQRMRELGVEVDG